MRVIYDNYDNENYKEENRLYKASIMEVDLYAERKDYSFWQSAIDLDGKMFTLEYDPDIDISLEQAQENIAMMDKISESLGVF